MPRRFLVALSLLLAVAASQASIIDFENLPNSDPNYTLHGDTVTSGGFQFASNLYVGAPEAIASWGNPGYGLYTGSVAIFANYGPDYLTMSKVGGGAFDVFSIDMTDVGLFDVGIEVVFTGRRADNSTVTETIITTDRLMTTYTLSSMTNIVSMDINDANWVVQFDNIATAVPEPATLAVLSLGAAALLRRRRS